MGDRNGARRPDRRRQFFINREFQGRFALCFLVLGLFIAFAAGGAIWHLSSQGLERHIFRSHVTVAGPWEIVFPILVRSLLVSACVLLLFTLAAVRAAFRKITEALAPLDEAMNRIGAGDLTTDVPEGGVEELNETMDGARETLRTRVMALRGLQERMSAEVSETGATDEAVQGEMDRLCAAFREALPVLSDRT
jgi:methyl-accepting chemotaxis protein